MKKMICLLIAAALLAALFAGCGEKTPPETAAPTDVPTDAPVTAVPTTAAPVTEPATVPETTEDPDVFRFTRENFPRLDGSTACLPMAEAVCSVLLGEDRESVQDLIHFNRTTQSFRNLREGSCDLLLAGEPNAAVFQEMEEAGFEYDMEELGRDALIFLVNVDNPVDNITTEQLRGIYTGQITNWKELGGADAEIIPIQRNEGAGSQALMKKLVMQGVEMMEAPEEYTPGDMGELINVVKSYDRSANAIGYSVYYYAHDMEMAQGLKLLKVDGVEPNKETIRSGEYPHLNAYYCVIAHSAGPNSPTRILYNWLMTEEGQGLLESEGYVTKLGMAN
jgi:phosphate transport system substrate-binding protein